MDLTQTLCDNRYFCTLYFGFSLVDLDFDSRSQECEKVKLLHQLSKSFQLI